MEHSNKKFFSHTAPLGLLRRKEQQSFLLGKSAKTVTTERATKYLEIMMYGLIRTVPQSKTISHYSQSSLILPIKQRMRENCVTNYLAFQVLLTSFHIKIIHPVNKLHTFDSRNI